MRFFAVALFFLKATVSFGQAPEVPHKMQFAGITLTIRDDARREIQKDVDAFTKHPKYFGIKVERAKTYFPIIEKIFAEERLPDDFKYLALQESALISDAVSTSNAVGFWQFLDFTALSMGLRVDKDIDERMNLISSTRGAARYLKQNNYMFNNWLYALQSYQMGAGGVQRAVGDQHNGAKHMEITSETYWYVKKYLAHKIAFENAIAGEPLVKVVPYETSSPKSLSEIAVEVSVAEDKLIEFNKWAKTGMIPTDKPYTVLIPAGDVADFTKLYLPVSTVSNVDKKATNPIASDAMKISEKKNEKQEDIRINGIPVLKARKDEAVVGLADRANIDLSSFLKYNDISIDHKVRVGSYYFLAKKKAKSQNEFYKTEVLEDVWQISQHTGVQLKKLKKYNDVMSDQKMEAGTIVWLNGHTPKGEVMPVTDVVVLVDDEAEFEWSEEDEKEIERVVAKDNNQQQQNALTDSNKQDSNELNFNSLKPDIDYVVKQGETLYSIAKSNNIEVVDLLAWNKITISEGLKPGQSLKVTSPEPATAQIVQELPIAMQVHDVQAADTLYSVARKYGVTIKEIMDWNEKKDLSITLGEKLRILQK